MSDGASRGPYRTKLNIDQWIDDLIWEIAIRSRSIKIEREDALREELKPFSIQVINASKDGYFHEITGDEE